MRIWRIHHFEDVTAPNFAHFRCDVAQTNSKQTATDEIETVHATAETEELGRVVAARAAAITHDEGTNPTQARFTAPSNRSYSVGQSLKFKPLFSHLVAVISDIPRHDDLRGLRGVE